MKKLVCLGLVAAMVVSLAACGSSNTKSTESKASESESSAETAAETESQLQQSEIQPQRTDQQISRINYYDTDG